MIRGLSALVLPLVVAACGGASLPPAQSALPPTQPPPTALATSGAPAWAPPSLSVP